MENKTKSIKVIYMITRVAIFGALSIILYMVPGLQFSVPFAPAFLQIHFDEVPVLLAGFAYGPWTAFAILILKSLLKLIQDIPATLGVGVMADFIYGAALILPASFIYRYNRTFKGVLSGILIGLFTNLLFSCIVGLYTIFPLYGIIYGNETIVSMFNVFDRNITSLTDIRIGLEFLLPFNLLKNGLVLVMVFLIYKPMRIIIERIKK